MEEGKENERRMRWGQKRSRQRRDGRKEGRSISMYIKTSSWRRKGGGQRKKEREHGRANIKWKNLLFLRLGLLFPFGGGRGRKEEGC